MTPYLEKTVKQYSLSITVDNKKTELICKAPTKAQFILHELIL